MALHAALKKGQRLGCAEKDVVKLKWKSLSRVWLFVTQNTGVGSISLLQGVFPAQGSNPGLPHYRQILYLLSHKGSSKILEWEPIPSQGDLPDSGTEPVSPALQADSLATELWGNCSEVNENKVIQLM